jgi:hypothetical protein
MRHDVRQLVNGAFGCERRDVFPWPSHKAGCLHVGAHEMIRTAKVRDSVETGRHIRAQGWKQIVPRGLLPGLVERCHHPAVTIRSQLDALPGGRPEGGSVKGVVAQHDEFDRPVEAACGDRQQPPVPVQPVFWLAL